MLLVMLGGVLLLMRALQQPAAVDLLGRVFTPPPDAKLPETPAALPGQQSLHDGPLAAIKDNAMFLPEERPAWDALIERLRATPAAELSKTSVGEVAYAQLVGQPERYRGQVVRVRGRVLRESHKAPAGGDAAGVACHQLVLAPAGGGPWPIIVYSLTLPADFPRGPRLNEPVEVDGLFFKVWSYAHDDGLGLAPVVLARGVQWQGPAKTSRPQPAGADRPAVAAGILGAAAAATLFAAWVKRQTGRQRPSHTTPPDFAWLETES
ncbi:MAG: hypothetical protein DCC67_10175 [Planctomycetota bacterium]|nr:MAG: hypothetical protein DCC67_10175 [Planctomycetota bacterium]